MDRKAFYSKIGTLDAAIKAYGFKRIRQGVYVSANEFELRLVLDKWGWTEDVGWGFVIRLTDLACPTEADGIKNYLVSKDIRADRLLSEKLVNKEELRDLYKKYKGIYNSKPEESHWFQFYDVENLENVINLITEPVIESLHVWIKDRDEAGRVCPVTQKASQGDIKEFASTIDEISKRIRP